VRIITNTNPHYSPAFILRKTSAINRSSGVVTFIFV
jgi:hypothetical protein